MTPTTNPPETMPTENKTAEQLAFEDWLLKTYGVAFDESRIEHRIANRAYLAALTQSTAAQSSETQAKIDAALQAQASKWQMERKELCTKLLVALSTITTTPEETYGDDIHWAVADACKAVQKKLSQQSSEIAALKQGVTEALKNCKRCIEMEWGEGAFSDRYGKSLLKELQKSPQNCGEKGEK